MARRKTDADEVADFLTGRQKKLDKIYAEKFLEWFNTHKKRCPIFKRNAVAFSSVKHDEWRFEVHRVRRNKYAVMDVHSGRPKFVHPIVEMYIDRLPIVNAEDVGRFIEEVGVLQINELER